MAINTNNVAPNMYAQTYGTDSKATGTSTRKERTEEVSNEAKTGNAQNLGKTIGQPKLSKEAQKYYDKLKKKFGNYDFILVSEDQKANAQANAGKYANNLKTVVLIDEAKIERMATDESFRKKYEGILSGAASQLQQMKSSMESTGANVKGYGMQVNDNGTTSFFAVLKKSAADQKARIEKTAEKKKAERKAADKKAEKELQEERLNKSKTSKTKKDEAVNDTDTEDTVTITANSLEELLQKISDYSFAEKSDTVQTDAEKLLGQHIDFKG